MESAYEDSITSAQSASAANQLYVQDTNAAMAAVAVLTIATKDRQAAAGGEAMQVQAAQCILDKASEDKEVAMSLCTASLAKAEAASAAAALKEALLESLQQKFGN